MQIFDGNGSIVLDTTERIARLAGTLNWPAGSSDTTYDIPTTPDGTLWACAILLDSVDYWVPTLTAPIITINSNTQIFLLGTGFNWRIIWGYY